MENSFIALIILFIIIAKRYDSAIKGKKKKVTLTSLLILPIILIYMIYSSINPSSILTLLNNSYLYIIPILATIVIGIIIGLSRVKHYKLHYDISNGEVYSTQSVKGLIFLVILIAIKVLLGIAFGYAGKNILILGNDCLLLLTVVYIITMRIITVIKYFSLKAGKQI